MAANPVTFHELVQKQRTFFNNHTTWDINLRKDVLEKLLRIVEENKNAIFEAVNEDLRRSRKYFATSETADLIAEIKYTLKHLDEWVKPEKSREDIGGGRAIYKDPLGVVLVIAPFNIPFQLALRPAAAAIAAGNTVILKPSELSGKTAGVLRRLINNNFADEHFHVVLGDETVAKQLLNERFDKIFYSGGINVAREILRVAAETVTPVTLELGGKSPCYIDASADFDKTLEKLLTMKFFNSGQMCLATDYVLLHANRQDEFFKKAAAICDKLMAGRAIDNELTGRIINDRHWELIRLIDTTSAELIYSTEENDDRSTCFIAPRIFLLNDEFDALMQEEIFGPLLPVLVVQDAAEAIRFICNHEKPLCAHIFTEDESVADRFLKFVLCGNSMVNGVVDHYKVLDLPFGGVGQSGMGRSHGKYGFLDFCHEKAVLRY